MKLETNRPFAEKLDRDDPLKKFRDQFLIPKTSSGEDEIYLCGNSLGLQPKAARESLDADLKDWETMAVKGHFEGQFPWKRSHEFVAEDFAYIVGAKPDEVVAMNTLTVNLHLMMVSFYRPTKERYKILIEEKAFPSDRYAVESQIQLHGYDPKDALVLVDGTNEAALEAIESQGSKIALVLLPGVQYLSGYAFDVEGLSKKARDHGCVVGWDLAHAVGNIPLKLHDANADFAAWCSYKYLNGGPGAIAGAFVHERHHQSQDLLRFAGWWGHNRETRFKMPDQFDPVPSAEGWAVSNLPIFSLSPLRASLPMFKEAGFEALRTKSLQLTDYLHFLVGEKLGERVKIRTPEGHRGCQLSLDFESLGENKFHELLNQGVTCDWREPGVVRAAPTPLYNRYTDCFDFVERLASVLS